ncbi:MoxR-like ATPase, AAA family [Estrella lausannensis]|uniref:MoxR-like ATPase, AAA family n=2 Tax=Estrella lausannensis TaxID=483423 RepID=A0A0H5DNN2_9BACT|nr:MoxR family ATPase [Estrella lausannensis]CRX37398.1 MoxR-like ATPase, AAA family [Estrella lausannensis]
MKTLFHDSTGHFPGKFMNSAEVNDLESLGQEIKQRSETLRIAREEISKVIVGQSKVIDSLFIALLCNGHILLEGVPGLAKTLIATTLSKVIDLDFKRVQFTPDLLPADLTGTVIYNPKEAVFTVKKGPIFTNLLLADEINRAPAKVQSALLEVMQERQVTIGGETFKAASPYLVIATQNPVEQEGTYPLPEAQTDRFLMKVKINYPSMEEEKRILASMASLKETPKVSQVIKGEDILGLRDLVERIYIDEKIIDYILAIIFATRRPKEFGADIEGLLAFGASPRASIALKNASKAHAFLSGRAFVTPHDIKQVAFDVLRHRLRRSYEAEAENLTPEDIIDRIFKAIPVP